MYFVPFYRKTGEGIRTVKKRKCEQGRRLTFFSEGGGGGGGGGCRGHRLLTKLAIITDKM